MVNKCLGKVSKDKSLKTISKINFDEDIGNWTVDIARQKTDETMADPTSRDFTVEKVNLGEGTHTADALHFEVSTKKMLKRSWEDEKDKSKMKEIMSSMTKYIEAINNPNLQPISQTPTSFDPNSPFKQKTIDQIQICRLMIDVIVDWLGKIHKAGGKYYVDLSKIHDDANTVTKELENEIVKWKNEEVEGLKRATQMREVHKNGVMKFVS